MVCKFCDYEGADFRPCEYSSDPETGEPHYCGNLECPRCSSCQGQEATEDLRRVARLRRQIREEQ